MSAAGSTSGFSIVQSLCCLCATCLSDSNVTLLLQESTGLDCLWSCSQLDTLYFSLPSSHFACQCLLPAPAGNLFLSFWRWLQHLCSWMAGMGVISNPGCWRQVLAAANSLNYWGSGLIWFTSTVQIQNSSVLKCWILLFIWLIALLYSSIKYLICTLSYYGFVQTLGITEGWCHMEILTAAHRKAPYRLHAQGSMHQTYVRLDLGIH